MPNGIRKRTALERELSFLLFCGKLFSERALFAQEVLHLGDGQGALVEQAGRQHRRGAVLRRLQEVLQLARAAGNMAQLMAKEGKYGMIRLPSGELRNVQLNCMATIGQVGNIDHENVNIGKAGRTRHMGIRPTVRGSVMNPCDHPHGGGEGRAPIGRPGPVTPWGKPALGYKTRDKHKASDKFIVKRRNAK